MAHTAAIMTGNASVRHRARNQHVSGNSPENLLSNTNMEIQCSSIPRPATTFNSLPFEILCEVLCHFDEYKDLLNAMCASRFVYTVFRDAPLKLLSQVALNKVHPEALQMALAAFYCTTNRLPYVENSHPDQGKLKQKGFPAFRFPFKLPFPKQQSDITAFFHFSKLIQSVAEILVAKCHAYHNEQLSLRHLQVPSSHIPLSVKERGDLEKKLYQYEFIARTLSLNEDGTVNSDGVPFRWRTWLLKSLGVVEYQQLLTIEKWVLADLRSWELEFHTTFVHHISKIAESSKVTRSTSLDPTHNTPGTQEPLVDVQMAIATGQLLATMPYLGRMTYSQAAREHCIFVSVLQTYGLKLYKVMVESSSATRHDLMIRCHKMVERMSRRATAPYAFVGYFPLVMSNHPYIQFWEWANDMQDQRVGFPNAFTAEMIQRSRQGMITLRGLETYAIRTGWWFWDDAHMSSMHFDEHCSIFGSRKVIVDYHELCGRDNLEPVMTGDLMVNSVDYTLPQTAWEEIVAKYQMDPSELSS
ncbi:hypothetical protein F5B22DRAFT_645106 [Xylaria bambusicola]|uniref:uncharacterized protein n=1 Tax=Xylaria bambusicola TaxID=326684 RepID=UPI002008BBCD|nr:uncharacterized protein F5B22DRAFT_645106 [Xylaria bambusicola]KAI0518341.1 hypothetical protein F5B22DRAFT_645106 [Xylaria bambusicola]